MPCGEGIGSQVVSLVDSVQDCVPEQSPDQPAKCQPEGAVADTVVWQTEPPFPSEVHVSWSVPVIEEQA
jgi:hypothetical protein